MGCFLGLVQAVPKKFAKPVHENCCSDCKRNKFSRVSGGSPDLLAGFERDLLVAVDRGISAATGSRWISVQWRRQRPGGSRFNGKDRVPVDLGSMAATGSRGGSRFNGGDRGVAAVQGVQTVSVTPVGQDVRQIVLTSPCTS